MSILEQLLSYFSRQQQQSLQGSPMMPQSAPNIYQNNLPANYSQPSPTQSPGSTFIQDEALLNTPEYAAYIAAGNDGSPGWGGVNAFKNSTFYKGNSKFQPQPIDQQPRQPIQPSIEQQYGDKYGDRYAEYFKTHAPSTIQPQPIGQRPGITPTSQLGGNVPGVPSPIQPNQAPPTPFTGKNEALRAKLQKVL